MKNKFFGALVISAFALIGCNFSNKPAQNPTRIILSQSELTLLPDQTETITLTVQTNDEELDKTIVWTISDSTVATLSSKTKTSVKVKAKAGVEAGKTAYVTAKLKKLDSVTAKCKVTIGEINPTAISIDSTLNLAAGRGKQLEVTYTPSNVNANKQITWSKESGDNDITVDQSGNVSVKNTATPGDTAVIKAQLTKLSSVEPARCTITVVEIQKDAWTIMMYVSGSDLESDGGAATEDMGELLSVNGQPEDINILYQTGGTTKWYNSNVNSDKSLSATQLQRWEVGNKQLVWKADLGQGNMGDYATLESYLKWGVRNYPAEKYAVIFWNHGGAMQGVCIDDNYSSSYFYDYLMNSEAKKAFTNVFNDASLGIDGKFEFVGYDACSMQVQDVAEFNSQFFNYMVASEELENGDGWDYEAWIDDLYAKKPTETILTAICDGFVDQYGSWDNDQTLSWLDLSAMPAYKTAWENMANTLYNNIGTYGASNFRSWLKSNVKYFGTANGTEGYEDLGIFDVKHFLTKIQNNSTLYNGLSTLVTNAETAFSNLVKKSSKGGSAGNAYGLCFFFDSGRYCYPEDVYTTSETNFTNWKRIVDAYGYSA